MSVLVDILRYRKMIAPTILEVLFWCGFAGTLYGAYWLFNHNHWAWWVALVFGLLVTRLIFEFAMLAFRSYDRLVEVRDTLRRDERVEPIR